MFEGIVLAYYAPKMKSEKTLALHKICGKELLGYAIDRFTEAGLRKWTLVGSETDAIDMANGVPHTDKLVAINCAAALISPETVKAAIEYHCERQNGLTSIICGGEIAGIITDRPYIGYHLESTVGKFKGKKGEYIVPEAESLIVTDRITLAEAENAMREKILEYHMRNGVTIHMPQRVYIENDTEIGADTEIYGGTEILSGTKIGKKCIIGSGSRLDGAEIGDNVEILSSVVLKSKISDGVHIGPFAYVRPNCKVGKNVKVGDFVEIKNSVIDDGTKISHLTYIGDSDVGKNVNFGCGTVTCNYDGKNKFRSKIGDNSFVGCNTNLVSPVKVGDRAYIAAGSTITGDVPEGGMSIARARQVNKEGWADEHKKY